MPVRRHPQHKTNMNATKKDLIMKTVSGGWVKVIGSFLMTHKRTYKMRYFIAVQRPGANDIIAMQISDIRGMTQKKAATLNKIIYRDVKLPPYIENDYI